VASDLQTIERASTHSRALSENVRNADMPRVSSFLLWGFDRYVRRLLKKNFSAVRVVKGSTPDLPKDSPVVCYANHPGWWDPLIAHLLNDHFMQGRTLYAPIDQRALEKYRIFTKLGYYGIDIDSAEGAKRFLATTKRLLRTSTTAIWMTPGGRFSDVRERTVFEPGLPHVAATTSEIMLVPVAVEYSFWEERTPEALVNFGAPVVSGEGVKADWQSRLEEALAEAQRKLAEKAIGRRREDFKIILQGSAGVGGIYDLGRRLKALLRGERFDPRHESIGKESEGQT